MDILHVDQAITREDAEAVRRGWREQTGRECVVLGKPTTWLGTITVDPEQIKA